MKFMILVKADKNTEAGALPVHEAADFGDASTPELREQEARVSAQMAANAKR